MAETTICPGCGVAVVLGYANCPRCHAPMPHSGRAKRASLAGGTSVETAGDQDPAGPRVPWLVIGLVVAAVVVAGAVFAFGGGSKSSGAQPAAAPVEPVGDSPSPTAGSGDEPPAATSNTPAAPDPAVTAVTFRRALGNARVFGSVDIAGDVLEIRSESCNEPALAGEINRFAADFRAGGVTSVRCRELHGAEVFTRPL